MTKEKPSQDKTNNSTSIWNQAITDTEERIKEAEDTIRASESKLKKLRLALRVYKGNRDKGFAWPGESATHN